MMYKTAKFLIIITIVALFASACKNDKTETTVSSSGRAAAKANDGDMLIFSSIGEPLNLITAISSDSPSHEVTALIYNGLINFDKNLNAVPSLAESWEISDDGLKITFHLRKDVKWHDGEPFSAKDVIFTYNFMLDNNTPTAYDGDFRRISNIEATDEYTVKVSYDEVYAPALTSWSMHIMPEHLLRDTPVTKSPLQRNPVGTGPYMFDSWQTNQSLTLKANPDYFEGTPHIKRIMFRYFQDQSTSFMELLNGSVDYSVLTASQYTKQTDNEKFTSQYDKYTYLADGYTYLGYNLTKTPFSDKRVRQALSYATPKEQIIESVLHGHGMPASGIYKPGTMWHNDNVSKYEYDLIKARELLAQAGYIANDKGRLMKDGKPLKVEILTNQNSTRTEIAEIIQKYWNEIGIDVNIKVAEWGAFINDINKRNFDITILAWNIVIDPDPSDVWKSDGCTKRVQLNFMCFQNEEADALMEAAVKTFDANKRKQYYDRFQEILAEEQPYTFLYVPYSMIAVSNRFEGVEPAPAGLLYNLTDWYVPQNKVKYNVK